VNFLMWIVIGGLIGWFASVEIRTSHRQDLIPNVIVGIVGAVLGGWLISPVVGASTLNHAYFSAPSLGISIAGALGLLAIARLFRNKRAI
jgi:uncharacterized membrane protein YeaQ/YmgE (transglycosylase-associated protein family)